MLELQYDLQTNEENKKSVAKNLSSKTLIESNLSLYGIPNQFDDFAKISTSVQDYPPSIVAYTMLILSLDSAALKTIKTRSKDENQLALAKINNRVRKIRGYPEFIA